MCESAEEAIRSVVREMKENGFKDPWSGDIVKWSAKRFSDIRVIAVERHDRIDIICGT